MISFIFAMDEHRLIGQDNRLPWNLPADLHYFKQVTLGHTVVMGRKTFESIGRPLPGRQNVVLTRQADYVATGCTVIHSLDQLGEWEPIGQELFVIGGAELFRELLPRADKLYITQIHASFEGDAYFPPLDESQWRLLRTTPGVVDERNVYAHDFLVYERVN